MVCAKFCRDQEFALEQLRMFRDREMRIGLFIQVSVDHSCGSGDFSLGLKTRRPYNLCCVGADVKPCSINQSRLFFQSLGSFGHKIGISKRRQSFVGRSRHIKPCLPIFVVC